MNKQLILKQRPVGLPTNDCWEMQETAIPKAAPGEIVIKQHYISLDPAMRGWLRDVKSYVPPVAIGEVMRSATVGEVIESNNNANYKVGDYLSGWGGVRQYVATDGAGYFKIDPQLAPLPTYIGALGMPGMTAYFGILKVGKIKKGDVVLISAASGAVGGVAGQIAKIKGCKVIGIAGGKSKCEYLTNTLKFDGVIDYKNENVIEGLQRECPEGVDVYFDNVGGTILENALSVIRKNARIVICGAISQYNEEKPKGPSNYLKLLVQRATMEGMVVFDYASEYGKAAKQLSNWMATKQLITTEDVFEGIEHFNDVFLRLFNGDKLGKLILKIIEE